MFMFFNNWDCCLFLDSEQMRLKWPGGTDTICSAQLVLIKLDFLMTQANETWWESHWRWNWTSEFKLYIIICLASRKAALANSKDPDETPHDAASHLGLWCLLKWFSVRNILNIEINILEIPNFGNKLIQIRRMGNSIRHKWVKLSFETAKTKIPCVWQWPWPVTVWSLDTSLPLKGIVYIMFT